MHAAVTSGGSPSFLHTEYGAVKRGHHLSRVEHLESVEVVDVRCAIAAECDDFLFRVSQSEDYVSLMFFPGGRLVCERKGAVVEAFGTFMNRPLLSGQSDYWPNEEVVVLHML